MTAIEKYTYALLEKQGFKKGTKDQAMFERAKRVIDNIIIPSQGKKAYRVAEEYIGITHKEETDAGNR